MVDVRNVENLIVDVDELLDSISAKYGDLDDDCGAYHNGQWLSIRDIVSLIMDCAYPNELIERGEV